MSSPGREHANDSDNNTESLDVHPPEHSSGEADTDDSPPSQAEQHGDSPGGSEPNEDDQSSGALSDSFELVAIPSPRSDTSKTEDTHKSPEGNNSSGTPNAGKTEDPVEDPVESIIETKLAELKRIQDISPEEEDRIREKIRKQQSGRWLNTIRAGLTGKNTVPIEYFNRLVAENESVIGYVASHTARFEKRLQEKDERIRELQQKLDGHERHDAGTQTADDQTGYASAKDGLQRENDDLKGKLNKCEAHGNQSDAKIQELEEAAALAAMSEKKAAGSSSGKDEAAGHIQHEKDQEEIRSLQAKIAKLEADLKTARETGSRHYGRVQELEQARQEGLAREQGLKSDVRKGEEDAKDLQKQLDDLLVPTKEENTSASGSSESIRRVQAEGAVKMLAGKNEKLRIENDGSRKECERLRREAEDLRKEVQRLVKIADNAAITTAAAAAPTATTSGEEAVQQQQQQQRLQDLTETIASRDRRIRELAAQNRALETERLHWMGGHVRGRATTTTAGPFDPNNNPQWWDQVEAITKAKRSLDFKVLALFQRLGFANDEELDGEAALDRLGDILDGTPPPPPTAGAARGRGKGKGQGKKQKQQQQKRLALNVLQLAGGLQAALRMAAAAGRHAEELERRARGPPAQAQLEARIQSLDASVRKVQGEMEKRDVMHRNHRNAFIGNLVGADQELGRVAAAAPHGATRDAINGVRRQFLAFRSWPDPRPELYMPRPQPQPQGQGQHPHY